MDQWKLVVMAAGEPRFDGSVFAELARQAQSGTIRVLDAMLLAKDDEGEMLMDQKTWRSTRQSIMIVVLLALAASVTGKEVRFQQEIKFVGDSG